jgi:hypothetical protein
VGTETKKKAKKKTVAGVMRMAGFVGDECKAGKWYQQVSRPIKKPTIKDRTVPAVAQTLPCAMCMTTQASSSAPVISIGIPFGSNSLMANDSLSPISNATGLTSARLASEDPPAMTEPRGGNREPSQSASTIVDCPTKMSSSQSSLGLTTRTNGRKTSAQAQAGRQNDMDITNLTKIAYKVGTLLVDSVQKNENPLTNF